VRGRKEFRNREIHAHGSRETAPPRAAVRPCSLLIPERHEDRIDVQSAALLGEPAVDGHSGVWNVEEEENWQGSCP